MLLTLLVFFYFSPCHSRDQWKSWLHNFGHDNYQYPSWIIAEMDGCECSPKSLRCFSPQPKKSDLLTFCEAKEWLLSHMPSFDLHYLPPSVWVRGGSMFDDNIAFSLMALRSISWRVPKEIQLSYILPYATTHESRVNWRPLLFAKFFHLVSTAKTTVQAMKLLASPPWGPTTPNNYLNWTSNFWNDFPQPSGEMEYYLRWESSTTPPVISPFDFSAYGYASCTGTATMLTYVARSVGIPARICGTPCWNTGQFAGLAKDNKNVSICWNGGNATSVGGLFLNNHNWVEYWSTETNEWVFINVPPVDFTPNSGLCSNFSVQTGCGYSNASGCKNAEAPGLAMRDHEIFSYTWDFESEHKHYEGGHIIDVKDLKLSSGEVVSPLVWSPNLKSPLGTKMKNIGLRVVNRTDFYRCKFPSQ